MGKFFFSTNHILKMNSIDRKYRALFTRELKKLSNVNTRMAIPISSNLKAKQMTFRKVKRRYIENIEENEAKFDNEDKPIEN